MGFATHTVLCADLSVGLGWGGVGFATQTVLLWSCLWGWDGVGFATMTVLCAVLSGDGVCNTDRVTCGPVCGGGVEVCNTHYVTCDPVCGVGWGLQHRLCYMRSCMWGGVGWGVQHTLCYMRSCLWGWGVGGGLQHRPCYMWSCLWGWGGVGVCNTDCVTCGPVCGVGVGWEFATQTVLHVVLSVGLGWGGGLQHRLCYMRSIVLNLTQNVILKFKIGGSEREKCFI